MKKQVVYTVLRADGTLSGRLSGSCSQGAFPKPYASQGPATAACCPGDVVVDHVLWHDLKAAAKCAFEAYYSPSDCVGGWEEQDPVIQQMWGDVARALLRAP